MAHSRQSSKTSSRAVPVPRGGRPAVRRQTKGFRPALQILEARNLPSFVAPRLFPVGYSPTSLVVADFNGDGIPDVVTANSGANTVSVLLGNGDGTFKAAQNIPVGAHPNAVAVADLTGTGVFDLVVADGGTYPTFNDSDVQVLLGNGDGTFQRPVSYGAGIVNPRGVAVADLNGDGILDLAVADGGSYGSNAGAVWVLLGTGGGSFQPGQRIAAGVGTKAVAVGDFNGDGVLDLAVANQGADFTGEGSSLSVLLGNGDGTFQPPVDYQVGAGATAVAVADFNGDGIPDLVATNFGFLGSDPGVHVLLGHGDGSFAAPVTYFIPAALTGVAVGDLNGDGICDVVVGGAQTSTGGARVLLGRGDGSFAAPVTYDVGGYPGALALADVNGDGATDLITADLGGSSISVVLGNGDGTFRVGASYAVANSPTMVVVRDLTGNGIPDIVTASVAAPHSISVLLGNGDGTFRPAAFYDTDQPAFALAVADLNGDGFPDIVTTSIRGGEVSVLFGNGDGTFRPAVTYAVGTSPAALTVGDFNGDGIPDLALGASGASGNTLTVLLGNGDGTFRPPQTFAAGGVVSLTVGDFNHDGIPDLIALNQTAGTVDVMLGNGDGTFRPPVSTPVPDRPSAFAVGDFNGDGIPDVAVSSAPFGGNPSMNILLGNGDGTFRSAGVSLPVSPSTMTVGDVNRDGKLDLITNGFGGTSPVTVWLGNGDGTFQAPQSYYAGFSATAMALADLNGDGFPELVTTGINGSVSVLSNAADWGVGPAVHSPSRRAAPRRHPSLDPRLARALVLDVPVVAPVAMSSGDRSGDLMPPASWEAPTGRPVPLEGTTRSRLLPARDVQDGVFEELGRLLNDDIAQRGIG